MRIILVSPRKSDVGFLSFFFFLKPTCSEVEGRPGTAGQRKWLQIWAHKVRSESLGLEERGGPGRRRAHGCPGWQVWPAGPQGPWSPAPQGGLDGSGGASVVPHEMVLGGTRVGQQFTWITQWGSSSHSTSPSILLNESRRKSHFGSRGSFNT